MKKVVSMILITMMMAQFCTVSLFAGEEDLPPADPVTLGEQQEPAALPVEAPGDAPETETPEATLADEEQPLQQGEQEPAEPGTALAPQAGEGGDAAVVSGMLPENGAVNVPYNGKVRILFGQAMNTRAVSARVELHAIIGGKTVVKPAVTKAWEPDGKTCVASYENLGFATEWAVVIRGFYAHGEDGGFIEIPETVVGHFTTIPKPTLALITQPEALPAAGGDVALTATLTDIVAGVDYPLEWTATGGSLAKTETNTAPYTNTLTVPAGHKGDILVTVRLAGQSEVLETVLLGTGKTTVTLAGLTPTNAPYSGAAQVGYTGQPLFRQGEADITGSVKNLALTAVYTGRGGTLYGPSTTPPTGAGLYSVRLGLYSDDRYTATTTLDFSIGQIEQELPALTRAFTYGQRLKDNAFSDANETHNGYFQWLEPEASAGDATLEDEERVAYASFRPNSPNYKTIERMAIKIVVGRAPVWTYANDVVLAPKAYDGTTLVGATTSFGGLNGSDVLTTDDYTAIAHFNSPNVAEANTVTVTLRLKETQNTRNYYLRSVYYDGPESDFDEPVDYYGYYEQFVLSGQSMEKGTMSAEDFSYTLADGYYNGSPQGPKVEVKRSRTGYGPVEIWTAGAGYDAPSPPTNAGTYTLRAEVAEGPNYKACTVPLGSYAIGQASIQDLVPRIYGPARVGGTLQATLPVAAGNAFVWAWYRDGAPVPDVSTDTYRPVPEDEGHTLTAKAVTGNGNYGGQSAVSLAVTVLPALPTQNYGFVQPAPVPFVNGGKAMVELVAGHADAGLKLIEYKSGNTRVFTVEEKPAGTGPVQITLAGVGTATLTGVWEKDGTRYTANAEVRVAGTAELSFKLTPQNTAENPLKLNTGATKQIKAAYQTAGITVASLGWGSSDPKVAAVDTNGLVTGVGPGTTTITASATDILGRTFERTCAVQVLRPTTGLEMVAPGYDTLEDVPRLVLAKYGSERNLNTIGLAVEASPMDATDTVKWTSSNPTIATVGDGATGGASITLDKDATVTVKTQNKAGTFTIMAQAGSQKVSYKFRSVVPAEKIVLTNSGASELNRLGQTTTIKAYAAAADGTRATDSGVNFISRDEGLATVTTKGVVTARGPGTVFIDIAAKDDPSVLYENMFGKGVLIYLVIMPKSLKLDQGDFIVAHSVDPENPVVLPITATLNGGDHVTIKYSGVKYSIPNTDAFEFTGPEYEGSTYYKPDMAEGAPHIPVYIKLKTLPPNTSITTRITAYSAVYGNIKTHLDVTVTSKGVTNVSQLTWSNEGDAPGTTAETQLPVGASYTPVVQVSGPGGAAASNRNMTWEISAAGKKHVAWEHYVTFDAATGKVTATRASIDNAVTFTVTGSPADPDAAASILPVRYSFMVRQEATGVGLALDGAGSRATLPTGGTTSLRATVAPANTTDASVAWTASKPEMVSFSSPTTSGEPVTVTSLK
ncbi:Ig-like domain-containing protein, partial [Ruminococcaceae bacterium OttesenSCG-928-D13]|nr:Ig-like domain-containing protein [Ruminococcaceae bacterium OttesenSCG-928-D13]